MNGWDRQDDIPTERIPAAPPPVEQTREMPAVAAATPPRLRRRPPYGAVVRRLVLRFPTMVGVLLLAAWWSGILASGGAPTLADFAVPPVEALLVWAALYTVVTTVVDVLGWWQLPGRRELPTRILANWFGLFVVVIRPIHFRGQDIEAIVDTAGWLLAAYLVGMATTVAVERGLPLNRRPAKLAADASSLLIGVTVGMLAALPFTGVDFFLTRWARPGYDWALGWIDPGLGDGGDGAPLAVAGLAIAVTVLAFARRWRGLGRRFSALPLVAVLTVLVALVLWYPASAWTGAMLGLPVWLTLVVARERILSPR